MGNISDISSWENNVEFWLSEAQLRSLVELTVDSTRMYCGITQLVFS